MCLSPFANMIENLKRSDHPPDIHLTLMIRKTFLAAVTEVWILVMLPGSPAARNMQAY